MKKRHLLNVFTLCCIFCACPVVSQANSDHKVDADSVKNVTQATNEDLQNKVDKIYKVLTKLPKVSGYLQTGYNWSDKDGDDKSSFQMKRMRLILDQKISPMFDFRAQFEVFSNSQPEPNKKKVMSIIDAFVDVHFNKALHFRVGQYYLPLGYENYDMSPATLETVDLSNIATRMVCRNAVSNPGYVDYGRDMGIMAYGDLFENTDKNFNYLSYSLSVTNGNLPTLDDDNKTKDVIGRLTFRPVEKLRITGSYNWGEYQGLNRDQASKKHLSMNRLIVGAWYFDPNGLTLRSEYGHLKSDKADVQEDGVYVLAGYNVGHFLPMVRWDMYRDDANKSSAANRDNLLAGCTYAPIKNIKFQLNYIHTLYTSRVKNEPLSGRTGSGNGVQIMCLAYF